MRTGRKVCSVLLSLCLGISAGSASPVHAEEAAPEGPAALSQPVQPEVIPAKIIAPNEDGTLTYQPFKDTGDILPNYSGVGYKGGVEEIPLVDVVKTLSPSGGDDTEAINQAIREVAEMPLGANGYKGAVLLKRGAYTTTAPIVIESDGIVLRGEGQNMNGTVITLDAKEQVTGIVIKGAGGAKVQGEKIEITDEYVPVGAYSFTVKDAGSFAVGDKVLIERRPNDLWVHALGMDQLEEMAKEKDRVAVNWTGKDYTVAYEREITELNGNQITIDSPFVCSFDQQHCSGSVAKATDSERIRNVGVENFRLVSTYDASVTDDENHGWKGIQFTNCKDSFARDITTKYFGYSAISIDNGAYGITAVNCSYLKPVSQLIGGRRYSFAFEGGRNSLILGCYSEDGRHDYVVGAKVAGPNAFVDSVSDRSNDNSETHHRWATGILYDNIHQITSEKMGVLRSYNRHILGSGHGWSGANTLFWNCLSKEIMVQKPPTEQNFAVGVSGLYTDKTPMIDYKDSGAYMEATMNTVEPRSIFKAQMALRLTGDYRNAIPNRPVIESPTPDSQIQPGTRVFGIYQKDASAVTIYIDSKPYPAALGGAEANWEFSLTPQLEEGYHTIAATQTIAGVESPVTAERTIQVGDAETSHVPDAYVPAVNMVVKNPAPAGNVELALKIGTANGLVNGKVMRIDADESVRPVVMNDRTLVPARFIAESLGGVVAFDDATATGTCRVGSNEVKFTLGESNLNINGKAIELEVPVQTIAGRTMLPLRAFVENLGKTTTWNEERELILVSDGTIAVSDSELDAIAELLQ